MINIKAMVICVAPDLKHVEIHTTDKISTFPFVIEDDRSILQNNCGTIINHIKGMAEQEGYNRVTCMKNNLVIYQELIMGLRYISGLEVKRLL